MSTSAQTPGPISGTNDALFSIIERMQVAHRPKQSDEATSGWGRFLDAGTGTHSLQWIQTLPLNAWDAVTADKGMETTVKKEALKPGESDTVGRVVLGNWDDPQLLEGNKYDVILADYLIGAMDGFSPFKQDLIFDRLKKHMDPETGILYIIGLEPIPYEAPYPESLIVEITRLRDACILLAGHRCYREHPRKWVERELVANGFKVLDAQQLPILYSEHSARRQLNVAKTKLKLFQDRNLAAAMELSIADLDRRLVAAINSQSPDRRIKHGFDYVIAAEVDPTFVPARTGGADAACPSDPSP